MKPHLKNGRQPRQPNVDPVGAQPDRNLGISSKNRMGALRMSCSDNSKVTTNAIYSWVFIS